MIQAGDYALIYEDSIAGFAIRKITNAPVNHAGIFVSSTEIMEALPGGVVKSQISKYSRWIAMGLNEVDEDQRESIAQYAESCEGEKYGWLQDAGFLVNAGLEIAHLHIPHLWMNVHQQICSALVDRSIEIGPVKHGLKPIDLKKGRVPGDVTPGDLMITTEARITEIHNM